MIFVIADKHMSTTLTIKDKSTICVGRMGEALPSLLPKGRVVVITDANIDRLYPDLVHRYDHIIVGLGEANKSLQSVDMAYRQLMDMGADRSTFILGIGGGIVTDMAGYIASTYMRGLDFGFISTTLLGQVDASVGGKNGVNVAEYKNMVGTISQPKFVISDVEMLRTLPYRELRAGMAEVVKSAIIGDVVLFEYLEREACDEIYRNTEIMEHIVLSSVNVKIGIVSQDEREGGLRRVLNLGHTIAHAIEKCSHDINHGEAVAIGLAMISRAAERLGLLSTVDADRVERLLRNLGFNLQPNISTTNLMREVKLDKKKKDNILRVVLPAGIGKCVIQEMPVDEFQHLFI